MSDVLGTKEVQQDVLLGFPVYDGKTEVEIAQEMYMSLFDKRVPVRKIHYYNGDSLVTRARNSTAAAFLDMPECDYLMFVDSDIRFQRWQIRQLRDHDKPIVGGVYLKKKLPYQPVCNHKLGMEGNLAIMREIGTGFMMIRKDVLGALAAFYDIAYKPDDDEPSGGNYYDFFQVGRKPGQDRYLSEDYYFCQMAADLGIKTYLDTSIIVEHWGKMKFPMADGMLVDGAALLMKQWHPDFAVEGEMKEKILSLKQAVDGLVQSRNLVQQEEPVAKAYASLEDIFKKPTTSGHVQTPIVSGSESVTSTGSVQDGQGLQDSTEPDAG